MVVIIVMKPINVTFAMFGLVLPVNNSLAFFTFIKFKVASRRPLTTTSYPGCKFFVGHL